MNGESDPSNPKKKRRTAKKDAPTQRVTVAASTAAAIRAMQNFGPQPMMGEKKENFIPANTLRFQNDINLVASNPFDDRPQRSFEIPTNHPHQLPPQFIANPTPRRGITPDQIGNMNYMSMRYMQQANQAAAAMNPMAHPPNRFENPSIAAINPMNNMRSMNNVPLGPIGNINNVRMQGNMNNNQMMNNQMAGAPMNGGRMINGPPMNGSGVGGLAMNGSTLISPMTGLISDPRSSPVNQMTGNRTSPVNPMANVPILSPLMSPNHMNSTLNMPPMNPMNGAHPQQHPNQMNNTRGPIQRPPNMPMPGMNPAMMGSNNCQVNMVRPFKGSPDMNTMNGNPRHPMGRGKPTGQEMNMGRSMFISCGPDPQGLVNSKPMGMPGSEEKIFPPNQPMVFNHQNPHAPPILPCGICRREVQATDHTVFCESGCNFWFHRQCAGLTIAAHEMLMNEPYAEWVCDKCLNTKDIPLVKYKP